MAWSVNNGYAPSMAVAVPGNTSLSKSCLSTLPSFRWLIPFVPMMNTSALWTVALVIAGDNPVAWSNVLAVTPKAIPSVPSTSSARKPANAESAQFILLGLFAR